MTLLHLVAAHVIMTNVIDDKILAMMRAISFLILVFREKSLTKSYGTKMAKYAQITVFFYRKTNGTFF
jgi:hypothetical protein